MYKLLKKKQGKRGGAKRGRAHTQKLVPGLGRIFRRNLALLRKRVKFVNPARAREKKEKNHAPLPRLAERPLVRKFVAPATDADVIAALRAFGVPNYTLGLPGDPAGRLRLLRGLERADSVRSWRISEQMRKKIGKLRDFVLDLSGPDFAGAALAAPPQSPSRPPAHVPAINKYYRLGGCTGARSSAEHRPGAK